MSTVDLIILGLVHEQPLSAYDIQKAVNYRNLDRWVKVSTPSIYKKVQSLAQRGFLSCESQTGGSQPAKTVYSITPLGREYFAELMEGIARQSVSILFDFNAVVANLNKLPPAQSRRLIGEIKENIAGTRDFMEEMAAQREHIPLVGRAVLGQQVAVARTLLDWIRGFERDFDEEDR
ncbi:PadR family transcriptional regulator [Harryflintia acetispora]|uniref:PadR family transcriptional regulator n=1 Tax=Harryflintia acetispora TaxID=1849041 RepID=UPI00189831A2|nr:PadR family transcriptional regulator [Harryflintia acetispora]